MNAFLVALVLLAGPKADAGTAAPQADVGQFAAISPASVTPTAAKPGVRVRVLLTPASTGAKDVAMAVLDFDADAGVALHRHAGIELLYVTQGTGEVGGGKGAQLPVGPGQLIYSAPNAAHQFHASTAVSVVAFYVPAGPELRFLGQADPGTRPATPEDSAEDPAPATFDPSKVRPTKILKGKGTARIVLDHANMPAANVAFSVIELTPKAEVAEHAHPHQGEVFYFLEGEAEMTNGDAKVAVVAPMAIRVPPGGRHSVKVTSKTPVRLLQLYLSPGAEQRGKGPAK